MIRIFMTNGPDRSLLLLEARNFLNGYGLTIDQSFLNNVTEKVYSPLTSSPPAYSVLVSVPLSLFPDNPLLASFILESCAAFLFLVYLYKIMGLLKFTALSKNLFLLLQGFLLHEVITSSGPTDLLAFAFIVAGWYYASLVILKKKHWAYPLAAIFFWGLASFTRYQYIPACLAGAAGLFYYGWKYKEQFYKRSAVIITISLVVMIGTLFLWQKISSGNYFYFPSPEKGWYPGNLLATYPFPVNSLLNLTFWATKISSVLNISYFTVGSVLSILSFPLFLTLYFFYLKWLRSRSRTDASVIDFCWLSGGVIATTTILFLVSLSLTSSPKLITGDWTFVSDGRYYAFPMLFFQLSIWFWAFQNKKIETGLKKLVVIILALIFLLEAIHGASFVAKKMSGPQPSMFGRFYDIPGIDTMTDFIKEEKLKSPSRNIAVVGSDIMFPYLANWEGVNGVFMINKSITTPVNATNPVILLIIVPHLQKDSFRNLINDPRIKTYRETDLFTFYTLELGTHN